MKQAENKVGLALILVLFAVVIIIYMKIFVSYETQERKSGHYTFGATFMTMNNDFYKAVHNEMLSQAEKNGDRILTLDPAMNVDKQKEQIYYLISKKMDAIIVTPVDWKSLKAPLKAAKKAGIPVIVVDAPVYNEEDVSTTIVSDNYNAGRLCAKEMMRQRKEANILLLEHRGAKSAQDRIQGFLDTIKGNDNYKIVGQADTEGQTERTLPKVEAFIQGGTQIDVVMALNDPTAIGALAAYEEAGREDEILVFGVDGSPDGKSLIQEKMLTATVTQSPKKMGKRAIEAAYQLVHHKKIEKNIIIPVQLVTQKNIQKFDIVNWQ